jgi:hypothetical protein
MFEVSQVSNYHPFSTSIHLSNIITTMVPVPSTEEVVEKITGTITKATAGDIIGVILNEIFGRDLKSKPSNNFLQPSNLTARNWGFPWSTITFVLMVLITSFCVGLIVYLYFGSSCIKAAAKTFSKAFWENTLKSVSRRFPLWVEEPSSHTVLLFSVESCLRSHDAGKDRPMEHMESISPAFYHRSPGGSHPALQISLACFLSSRSAALGFGDVQL